MTAEVAGAEEEVEWKVFLGKDLPPTSYGGLGGNANEAPVYKFDYPVGWKPAIPGKLDKGTKGIDAVVNSPIRGEKVFVITFARAGEDDAEYKLGDIETAFQGFVAADPDLQDAYNDADDIIKGSREAKGRTFFDIEIQSPLVRFVSTITTSRGKVYACFVRCPNNQSWTGEEPKVRHIMDSFEILQDDRTKAYA